jgi:hypothetical protein
MQPMRAMPSLASVGLLSLMILWPWRLGARAAAEPPTVAGPFEIAPRPKKITSGAAAHALVEKIGTRFHAELFGGEPQSRFGAYDDSR